MSERIYCFNKELRVWLTPEHDTMAYSDGEAVERQLLESLRKCRDLSSTSDELRKRIVDWPTEYHLSPQRHALLRPFTILPGDRVLELGCGCGAITRHLGETGATVVAVEGSQIRAQIAAERCRDLPNVSVYCDNLAAFENPDEFDFVTLIGVLEYSPQFIVGEDPVGTCLCKAKSHLRDCGSLILAIENRLGLKYLSGCKEDHVGHAFFGIEDLYDASTAVTLGRVELLTSLEAAGFAASQTLFPFPDYKLPDIIISEAGLADPRFRTSELLLRNHSPDRVAAGPRAFSEPLAWVTVCRNDLLPDLSNSFLVIAGKSGAAIQSRLRSFLAVSFTGRRVRRYITETLFHCAEGAIAVTKQTLPPPIRPEALSPPQLHLHCETVPYLQGRMYLGKLLRQWRKGTELEQLTQWARPWTEILFAAARPSGTADGNPFCLLPGEFFDCIPFNLLETEDGMLHFIDREWHAQEPIPLAWVFIRGLAYALANCVSPPGCEATVRSIIRDVGPRLGIEITEQDFLDALRRELAIQYEITGLTVSALSLGTILDSPARAVWPIFDAYAYSEEMNSRLRAALDAMNKSKSWKVTRPLRAAQEFLKRLASLHSRP